ncbi:restriction endonuclease subunit S [Aeromonas veronii]|uniref:Restriction endonuclease n=1 Tax=Aeromonas veronii TaxID=654 RepID=A0A2T4N2H1_AERVE|nr:restriction endonuclease [Aeromonas veronii]RDE60613.1 restriction endonuclease subunit S [Aeromonas veronii]UJP36557.1 restriction endonuclease subunit S [Aeromonas veronii]
MKIENLITDHLDLWSAAVRPKSSAGRGTSSKLELTGIKKLRELILELAVRGKLVPQDPSDEPASVLLERIAAERVRLVKEKKIKKSKALPEIGEEEKPFELPEGWEWKRLGDIVEVLDSMRRPITKHARSNGTYPYYGASGIVDYIDDFIFDEPLVLVGEDGAKWGKGERTAFSIDGKSWVNNHAHVIRPEKAVIVDEYLVYFLTACDLNKFITGITVPKLNQARLVSIPLAIPSIEEQHRIVAKVDELMALCDQLEQRSESQLAAHQTLVETLLATLTDSADANELAQNWALLSTHFDTLFTTEASIDALKQTILQLAVMGKLVPQDPSDEPASALLERITAEKAQLVKEKKIKKEKPLPAISEDEKPFELPQGWAWVRLGTLCGLITSGSRGWNQYYSDVGSIFIRSQDIKFDSLLFDDRAYVNLPNRTEGTRTRVEFGDMLMTITGANVAKVAIVSECFDDAYVSQHVALIRLIDNSLNKFIHVWLTCNGGGRKLLLDLSYGAKPGLNLNNINEVLVPLAPQDMQETILERVNELMTLCDRLKSRLATSLQTQLALAESLVEGALA